VNDCEVEISTERSKVVPEGVDPDESPFELQEIAGLPFGKNSAEARAIRRILDQADGEGAAASPWPVPRSKVCRSGRTPSSAYSSRPKRTGARRRLRRTERGR